MAEPDVHIGAGEGEQGQVPGDWPPTGNDWESLMSNLPKAGFEPTEFYTFQVAVVDALKTFYAQDTHVAVASISPPENAEGYLLECVWGRFAEESARFRDPLEGEANVRVQFQLDPAKDQNPALAELVRGDERIRWTSEGDLEPTLEALMHVWEPVLKGYSAAEPVFWAAFRSLHQAAASGHLNGAGGEFWLPGPTGYDCSLVFRATAGEGDCSAVALVRLKPQGNLASQPESWETLTSRMPPPGFGSALTALSESMVAAVRQTWAADPAVTIAWTGRRSSSTENWQEITFSWLRFPLSADDSGYLLETLTLHLIPCSEAQTGPLATAVTVTELVAWDPEWHSGQPRFTALAPARDFFLDSYLSPGEDFWEAFGELELVPGLTKELPGVNDTKIQAAVEEVTEEDGAVQMRYALTYLTSG